MSAEVKPAYGLERVHLAHVVPLTMPFTVFLSVSTVCNFKCKYCIHVLSKDSLSGRVIGVIIRNVYKIPSR
jgi:sulfatase maturation enzyme AslB (radical SAM superfamily)